MRNSNYLLILFALIASQAFCDDPVWNNSAFSIPPKLLKTVGLDKEHIISLRLSAGSGSQTNLLDLEYAIGSYRISNLMFLNTSELSIIQESTSHVEKKEVKSLAYASNGTFIFGLASIQDQILLAVYKDDISLGEISQVTNNTDSQAYFKILQLIAYGDYPIGIIMKIHGDKMNLHLGVLDPIKGELKQMLEIATGVNITDVRCDSDLLSKSVLCLYKVNATVYRVHIPLNSNSSLTKDQLLTDIPHGMDQVVYIPKRVVGTKDGFAYFLVSHTPDGSKLQGYRADTTGFLGVTYSAAIDLRSFSAVETSPLRGAFLYGDGFATFQRDQNLSSKTQTWSYTIYNQDLSVKQDEITFAKVTGKKSGFKVARDFYSGAINVAAYNYTDMGVKKELRIFYGQLLSGISEQS